MTSIAERHHNNFRFGVFVTVSLLLGMFVIVVLSDLRSSFASMNEYEVVFDVSPGVKHLKPGSDVRIGGLAMGKVEAVEFTSRDDANAPAKGDDVTTDGILVRFELDSSITLYNNPMPRIRVAGPLIGADSWLEIVELGGISEDPNEPAGTPLDGSLVIAGASGGGNLDEFLGPDGSVIIRNVAQFTDFLADIETLYESDVLPLMDSARETAQHANDFASTFRDETWPRWETGVDDALGSTNRTLASAEEFMDDAKDVPTKINDVIDENRDDVRATVESTRRTVEKAEGTADEVHLAVGDVRDIAKEIRGETLDKINAFLDNGSEAVTEAAALLEEISQDYPGWATDVTETLTSARQAGQQLKLTSIEVRRSPWKFLYRPSTTELEHELLYEAARSFAFAATDLTASSDAVARMLKNNREAFEKDPELLDQIVKNLVDPMKRFEKAQEELFSAIKMEQ